MSKKWNIIQNSKVLIVVEDRSISIHQTLQTLSAVWKMETAITIDGSYGEGGGQIIRNACTYAAILRKNIRITNIRAGRKVPGLRPQHLVGLRLLAAASASSLAEGNHVGSTEILFLGSNRSKTVTCNGDDSFPKFEKKSEYVGDTKTAGSVCLLIQTILPFAIFRGSDEDCDSDDEILKFILKGGTDVAFAPPLDYNRYVFFPVLCNQGCLRNGDIYSRSGMAELKESIDLSLVARGFYPRGGGEVHLAIRRLSSNSFPLRPIRLVERGTIVGITIHTFASGNCPLSKAQTLAGKAQKMILSNPRYNTIPITIEVNGGSATDPGKRGEKRSRTSGSGCGVLITAETQTGCLLAGSQIGSPKIPLEETARLATKEVIEAMDAGGCVDKYLQDQLIIYMALAGGVSEIVCNSFTMHTKTAIWLATQMLPSARFKVTKVGMADENTSNNEEEDLLEALLADTSLQDDASGCYRIRCHGIGCGETNKMKKHPL